MLILSVVLIHVLEKDKNNHLLMALHFEVIEAIKSGLLFFLTETWLSAPGDEAKTVELAPSGFDVKSFPRLSRSRGGGIVTACKSTLGTNITFKTNFDFVHTSFEVMQESMTLQHNTLHFFLSVPPSTKPTKQS